MILFPFLQRDMAKEQQRVRELEARNAQQKKVLKVKTEEMAAVQRRLRSGSHTQGSRWGTLCTLFLPIAVYTAL